MISENRPRKSTEWLVGGRNPCATCWESRHISLVLVHDQVGWDFFTHPFQKIGAKLKWHSSSEGSNSEKKKHLYKLCFKETIASGNFCKPQLVVEPTHLKNMRKSDWIISRNMLNNHHLVTFLGVAPAKLLTPPTTAKTTS